MNRISEALVNFSEQNNDLGMESAGVQKPGSSRRIFTVQRHLDSFLHYDLRIEIGGVLKCWAMPSGPSMNPQDRKLAVMVGDRTMDFASVKKINKLEVNGIIEMWDKGTLVPHSIYSSGCSDADLMSQIREGRLRFTLKGKKLKGVFSLIRINGPESKNWLLLKGNDRFAVNYSYSTEQFISNRSLITKALQKQA